MVLVVGSTGRLGGDICRRLNARGKEVRALVRDSSDPEKTAALRALGIKTVVGDLSDPASLAAACQGIKAVVSTVSTAGSAQPGGEEAAAAGSLNLLEAAKAAGVTHFVYISFSGNIDAGLNPAPLTVEKRAVEAAVAASGMDYTILRPSYFMESWLSPRSVVDYPNARATVFGRGDAPVSWISQDNVAQFAAASLEYSALRNRTLDLGGPEALSQREVIRIFEQVCGRPFVVETVTEAALQGERAAAQTPGQATFAALKYGLTVGDAIDMCQTLQDVPVRMVRVEDYARRVLGAVGEMRHSAEVLRLLVELVDFLVDAIGSGRRGFDYAIKEYVLVSDNELSRAFAEFVRRMGLGDEWEGEEGTEEENIMAGNIRREVLRGIAAQFELPELTRFTEALLRSQDERISLIQTLTGQAELLRAKS